MGATQIGSVPAPDGSSCSANSTELQTATASGGPSYQVPPGGGVITFWGYTAAGPAGVKKLKVFRPTETAGQYTVVGESTPQTPTEARQYTYPTRIPVKAGDIIGLYTTTANDCRASAASANTVRGGSGDPPPGSTFNASGLFTTSTLLDVAAIVEADADGDGYGDETQDGCPSDATVHDSPCQADLELTAAGAPTAVRLGDKVTYTLGVKNSGPTAAKDVVVSDVLPKGAALVSTSTGCTGFSTVTCKIGSLAPGASAPAITIVARAPTVGDLANVATVSASTTDPDTANNSVTTTTKSSAFPFVGAALRDKTVRESRGRVLVRVACPIRAHSCTGILSLHGIGKTRFKVSGGKTKKVRIALSRKAQGRIARAKRLRVTAKTLAHDSFGQQAGRQRKITILAARSGS
jgi:uncharacterized repeat protein (TIGR01451 family)